VVSVKLEHQRSTLFLKHQSVVEGIPALHKVPNQTQSDSSMLMGTAIGFGRGVHGIQNRLKSLIGETP
jgi:hypothetical protein